jgi:hypothetical protein
MTRESRGGGPRALPLDSVLPLDPPGRADGMGNFGFD